MEHQGNPNLINGFEDLMAHIQKLETGKGDGWYLAKLIEEECNKLKEENKKLTDKVNMYDDWVKDQKISRETLERENNKLKDDISKAYKSIETGSEVIDLITEIGIVVATKEEVDDITENEDARQILYDIYDDEENK